MEAPPLPARLIFYLEVSSVLGGRTISPRPEFCWKQEEDEEVQTSCLTSGDADRQTPT